MYTVVQGYDEKPRFQVSDYFYLRIAVRSMFDAIADSKFLVWHTTITRKDGSLVAKTCFVPKVLCTLVLALALWNTPSHAQLMNVPYLYGCAAVQHTFVLDVTSYSTYRVLLILPDGNAHLIGEYRTRTEASITLSQIEQQRQACRKYTLRG